MRQQEGRNQPVKKEKRATEESSRLPGLRGPANQGNPRASRGRTRLGAGCRPPPGPHALSPHRTRAPQTPWEFPQGPAQDGAHPSVATPSPAPLGLPRPRAGGLSSPSCSKGHQQRPKQVAVGGQRRRLRVTPTPPKSSVQQEVKREINFHSAAPACRHREIKVTGQGLRGGNDLPP